MRLGLEADPGAMEHDLVVGRLGPDAHDLTGIGHVKAHGPLWQLRGI